MTAATIPAENLSALVVLRDDEEIIAEIAEALYPGSEKLVGLNRAYVIGRAETVWHDTVDQFIAGTAQLSTCVCKGGCPTSAAA
ncbi:hypothetical protein [Leifsonia sp. Leaf264]|uniref:hypothetical protein n=1 Tax=Leifsonia sp. Leaf264 TaxID=1736314 RepID=UPI0006FEB4FF|nr:hypothetical protein [Leifsonia sp. Leaf264]KQO98771.1 hypothetical protein ASF30_11965 [Leifsonia sp. Leaf264]